jgi:hypothetical protein
MTPEQMKTALTELFTDPNNKVGGNILGTYTLPGGSVVPAIGNGQVPDDWAVTGVEAILPIVEQGETSWRVRHVVKEQRWEVYLVYHPPVPPADGTPVEGDERQLRTVVDRLERFLANSVTVAVPADDVLGTLPQARVSFPLYAVKEIVKPFCFSP